MSHFLKVSAVACDACVPCLSDGGAHVPRDTMRVIVAALSELHGAVPEHHQEGVADLVRVLEDALGVPHSRALAEMMAGART